MNFKKHKHEISLHIIIKLLEGKNKENLFLIYFFYWRIIALQNFAVFCPISTWISHRYTYIHSLLNLSPISCPIPPLWTDIELLFYFPESYSKLPLAIYFTYGNISLFPCYSLHTPHSLFPSPHVHKSVLYVCFSIAALQINSSVLSF